MKVTPNLTLGRGAVPTARIARVLEAAVARRTAVGAPPSSLSASDLATALSRSAPTAEREPGDQLTDDGNDLARNTVIIRRGG